VPIFRTVHLGASLLLSGFFLVSCTGSIPSTLGVSGSGMAPCPSSPNCVSSDAQDSDHQISPLQLTEPATEAWVVVQDLLAKLPRTRIVSDKPGYLHAECRSALLGFVDDLELNLRPSEGVIAVRSASRLGYSDFGVNRRRIEELRTSLINRGVVR
jgi:uncharacterized protein (DUF1499 family)